jgi:DNA-binding NarL/FixJ family response regulator
LKLLFLLIGGSQNSYWQNVLKETLAPLGHLQVVGEESVIDLIAQINYAAVIVDAGNVEDSALLTCRIRAQCPQTRVIIVTASPRWNLAREAFQSGATDYIYRSADRDELILSIKEAMNKPVLPWPR